VQHPPGDGGTALACPDEPHPGGALVFDGTAALAKTDVLPEFGLDRFTIEAWLRRDGVGKRFSSGKGGLHLVPIAAKGLGEGDGSNIDCNYAFGLWGDVLGADFEDMATGANHPVVGTTAIEPGIWHHVAVTFDGSALRLYLDGKPMTTATPRADSIHPFSLGSAIKSDGSAHGFLAGALDEVRVWRYARTRAEIAGSMFKTISVGDGLVARWSLDDTGDPTTAVDSAGGVPLCPCPPSIRRLRAIGEEIVSSPAVAVTS
jgi:hypothetical protein